MSRNKIQRITRSKRPFLAFEKLESRIQLSASAVPSIYPHPIDVGGKHGQLGSSFIDALQRSHFTTPTNNNLDGPTPDPSPNPDPNPNPDPTPDPAPTPDPDPAPPPAPDPAPPAPPSSGNTTPVTITQVPEGNLTRLVITGTSGDDSILVSQSGNTLTIVGNGQTSTVSGNFGELAIYGLNGNDSITVQSSVNLTSLLYGGAGNNTLAAGGSAMSFIIGIGAGNDTMSGNGVNTSFWADPTDTVNASATEVANGGVHRVTSFYQPFTNDSTSANFIPTTLSGQNLPDPTDTGSVTHITGSLWGSGPTMQDVNQGSVGDCYFLATLQSIAYEQPGKLEEYAVDLGDGTYAVEFNRGGSSPTYVRVDGDMAAGGWSGLAYAHPKQGGPIWAEIFEKAYAFYRYGQNTYASLNNGWTGSVFYDMGISITGFTSTQSNIFSQITTALANHKAVAAVTNTSISASIPIIASHAYSVVATSVVGGVDYLTVRNPWGVDGAGNDSNTGDGLVTITLAQFGLAFSSGSIQL